jgi:anthranilate synthase/aminodeoxychorismate synthase-like glutamine amidotransferase
MILIIDNYDSFTYNLVQYLGELGARPIVHRNDKISLRKIKELSPERIIISPGPGTPDDAGISKEVIMRFAGKIPLLGVCLGHQCIADVYGGKVIRAPFPVHGKTSDILHTMDGIYRRVKNPFKAMRYHSLIVDEKGFPECLKITGRTKDGLIMSLQHRTMPVFGVQYHPESIMTEQGKNILKNFLDV